MCSRSTQYLEGNSSLLLINVTVHPMFRFSRVGGVGALRFSREAIRERLIPALSSLFDSDWRDAGLNGGTPVLAGGVLVQLYEFGNDDIAPAGLWVKVQLSEAPPGAAQRKAIRDTMFRLLTSAVPELDLRDESDFVLDVLWGPMSGRRGGTTANGEISEW
jgi:hypothetical protein